MPGRRIAIIQSCYIPWKGFFDLIGRCDEYVVFDSAQYVKRHWHNRNRIKTANGLVWLTIPVVTKGRAEQRIDEVEIEKPWAEKHWRAIELAYRKADSFDAIAPGVQRLYEQAGDMQRLTDVNLIFLRGLVSMLGLKTNIVMDAAYPAAGVKTARLLGIAKQAKASRYLSGPSAKAYFDETLFAGAGIATEWMRYDNYPKYPQLHGAFMHEVSVLDLLFNTGADASRHIPGLQVQTRDTS